MVTQSRMWINHGADSVTTPAVTMMDMWQLGYFNNSIVEYVSDMRMVKLAAFLLCRFASSHARCACTPTHAAKPHSDFMLLLCCCVAVLLCCCVAVLLCGGVAVVWTEGW